MESSARPPGVSVAAAGMATGGSLTRWFRDNFAPEESRAQAAGGQNAYAALTELAAAVPPGSEGLVMLPYFAGERTPLMDAQARGVILLALAETGIPSHEYPPQAIKQAIVGEGRAQKQQVQELVKMLLALEDIPKPDHASDALAAAICHISHSPPGSYREA